MSILSWNCRGLGGTRTVRELLGMVSKQRPSFVFLMDTKSDDVKVEEVRVQLGWEGAFGVDRVGQGGGLALFWRDADVVTLLSFSLETRSSLPWIVVGDFNDITSLSEKRGAHSHPESLIEGFNDALSGCRLNDLGMIGGRFTWERGHGTDAWVEERLDRAVATVEWTELHEEVIVQNLHTLSSDHTAIFVDLETRPVRTALRKFSNQALFQRVQKRVTDEMNIPMLQPFTLADVKAVLFAIAPDKASGPDGMSPAFYQHFWLVLGHDLAMFILNCMANKEFPPGLNISNIVLLPKKKIPVKVSDLRPIALCNVAYKVFAKMMANRLKETLGVIVSQSQSAFVPERLLTDNIIIAGELGHYLRRKTSGVMGWTALKLDMAKAYDRMEWGYLEGMLGALGYAQEWIQAIMLCVSTVNYTIQVNGEAIGSVCPTRGIRQGDPLSPYLFILCAEGLSLLLQQAEARGDIHGLRVARGAPAITHLFFADDSLLFFRATQNEALKVKECLQLYSEASGQQINFDKSNAVFSLNTLPETRELISNCIGVHVAKDLGRYLGLPSNVGRNKIAIFRYVEEKIRDRIGMWQHKLLSRAGFGGAVEVMDLGEFIGYVGLGYVYRRCWGGLGFKKLHEFNLALLAKQGWRLLINPGSLVSKLLKAKYYPTTNFLEAKTGNNPSYLWRSIIAGQEVLRRGVARRIGDGGNTKIWEWGWLSDNANPNLHTPYVEELSEARVSGLMMSDGNWDVDILTNIFEEADVQRILATPVNRLFPDSWRWIGDLRGQYTVKHGYKMLMMVDSHGNEVQNFKAWKLLWLLPVPAKIKNLLWRCARGVLPTREKLRMRQVWIGGGCPMCGFPAETQGHLFAECWFATELWGQTDLLQGRTWTEFMEACITSSDVKMAVRLAVIVEVIRSSRNECVWRSVSPSIMSMHSKAQALQIVWEENFGTQVSERRSANNTPWSPPPRGRLKCNVDAAISPSGVGFGAILRDHSG
ncbi:PREDICTED: uncharacterized protein LOC109187166 [Ipomoea nil]|uniref:uncharacterized protein LOC109187166 n=1 Tax=Ipomoea nil TaxID=35883 RepID=UPI000900C7A2|nr:PREDICTED: uncharacterized protein LOC109187166 [Ipomoea nil]